MYHANVNIILMIEKITCIKSGIMIIVGDSIKNPKEQCVLKKKSCTWNPAKCNSGEIINMKEVHMQLVIWNEIIEETKTIPTKSTSTKTIPTKITLTNFYILLAILLITIA